MTDFTHDPEARCWFAEADGHPDFPVQNLPLGVFTRAGASACIGTAIGDHVLDLASAANRLSLPTHIREALRHPALNRLFELPPQDRKLLRQTLFAALTDATRQDMLAQDLYPASACTMELPLQVRDYTDFYAGIHHASAVGALMRPENPLLPNYKFVPVGYHGRASSVRASGHVIRRPSGQTKAADATVPEVTPTRRLDYEVELGFWIAGQTELGQPLPISRAAEHIAGVSLLNDWSARDIQAWEYVPLGPFLAKNFATTVSPWVVTAEALEPFRIAQPPRPAGDPAPLPYLLDKEDQKHGAFSIRIEVALRTRAMREAADPAFVLGKTSAAHLYWTPAQMLAHHTVNGCDLAAGDLVGTGTISGPDDTARGSLMELSRGGSQPIVLPNGETRTFLADGDEVILTGWAEREGWRRIGLGRCSAVIAE